MGTPSRGRVQTAWLMTDLITYRLPSHTDAVPDERTETVQDAISGAYHQNWKAHSSLERKDKRDTEAGMSLPC